MLISKYFVWFIIYSFFGWIYESTYCTIKGHKWENRGFLYGPIVPIYGVGALLASIVFSAIPLEGLQQASNLKVFIICFLGSIVLEYSTSWILEKLFHAYWWDYSNVFCNINGRVCLPASIGFGVAGILVINVFFPLVSNMTSSTNPLLMEFLSLLFMLMFGMDMALTVSSLTNFAKNFARIEKEINDQISAAYDSLESNIVEKKDALVEKKDGLLEMKESLIEKKEQFTESSFVKKEIREERRDERTRELKERLTNEYLERMMKSASAAQKGALRHIQGFKRESNSMQLGQRMKNLLSQRK